MNSALGRRNLTKQIETRPGKIRGARAQIAKQEPNKQSSFGTDWPWGYNHGARTPLNVPPHLPDGYVPGLTKLPDQQLADRQPSAPSGRVDRFRRRQFQFGPPLADGYVPEYAASTQEPQQRTEQRTPAPASRLGASSHSRGDKKISQRNPNLRPKIEHELADVRTAWRTYQASRGRAAVFIYLEAVFTLVTRWRSLNCALKNSRAALAFQANAPTIKHEPFGVVIFCTSDTDIADAKTRSKWSRVLRFARKAKPAHQSLTDWIKQNGGLNEVASRFAKRSTD